VVGDAAVEGAGPWRTAYGGRNGVSGKDCYVCGNRQKDQNGELYGYRWEESWS
jgi:hypothetical protein